MSSVTQGFTEICLVQALDCDIVVRLSLDHAFINRIYALHSLHDYVGITALWKATATYTSSRTGHYFDEIYFISKQTPKISIG